MDRSFTCRRCSLRHSPMCPDPGSWPAEALMSAAGIVTTKALSVAVKASRSTVRLAIYNGLSDMRADEWAVACGLHPAQVWPGWVDAGLSVTDRQFLDSGWRQAWLHTESVSSPEGQEAA